MEKVLIAMSGGVDSSAAAHLILSSGYEAIGATMTVTGGLYGNSNESIDALIAARICERLGIEHKVIDLKNEFRKRVADDFVERYLEGKTPNPCIVCNKYIKFGALMDVGQSLGCERIATGHYARIECDASGRYLLKTATDEKKDQSYMLWTLSQEQLSRVIFPLGVLTKPEVRILASGLDFENAEQKDSQDVCFIPNGNYADFIKHHSGISPAPGNYIDLNGNAIGRHKGVIHYTIGQRKGLGISLGKTVFVCGKNAERNEVVLGDSEDLFSKVLTASDVNLIACDKLDTPIKVTAKTRYHQIPASATVEQIDERRIRVEFDEAVRAISPGQSVVLYDGDTVIGGGFID